ncbi:MAG: methylmalonyl Co-A mutase-associated GTPase MeaB [Flavobacteriales bacterium]|jgi:LAO/AO transport system kinase|nr:methylmalonyl Co-A mutase-associated GTPase MeaB [Flavobacteriales bacterium]MBK6551359.1 methylmalonyl Co-A mutase-associated GTPase MeaB [Flavobacteriales bacterium]MBK6882757.1 methylmalonyl Co-A mutase-associated GTPase MeaB [Flavobacteriales bacterium]MBK7101750.1 methylmalonyl Co-A mutase-associated GTPase MeaB [Flavobacteriales bacterium]MBK7483846.1 methylmalonyl Co-A mutase-associated GTPase MeaB [Flavobacteriales bacterium]
MPLPELIDQLRSGDRVALGKAITLVESTREQDREQAVDLVESARPYSGKALRLGITGIPGAGKSTLIDPLGRLAINAGHRVAVLATDPSSQRSGGSILGDKTRMEELARSEHAFIRPSANNGTLGGVARRTQESIVLCEAAGYDLILVETVGIGQSELEVDRMTDLNVLLTLPGTGDELQGIKRGVMESADVIVLTKASSTEQGRYHEARSALRNALAFLPPRDRGTRAQVFVTDALSGTGMAELWQHIVELAQEDEASGYRAQRRQRQQVQWLHHAFREGIFQRVMADGAFAEALAALEEPVRQGEVGPFKAASELLSRFRTGA